MDAQEAAALAKSKSMENLVAELDKRIEDEATKGSFGFTMNVDYMDKHLPTVLMNLKYRGFTVRHWANGDEMCNTWSVSW